MNRNDRTARGADWPMWPGGRIFDVSMPIYEGMPVYKDKPEKQPHFVVTADHPGQGLRESRITLDTHTGTHVDAPLHVRADGETTDSLPPEALLRLCRVVDLTHVTDGIEAADLQTVNAQRDEFLLLKTRNSSADRFDPAFVFLTESAAHHLADRQIAGVGVDGLGVERDQPGHPTHNILFAAGAIIMEGLRLAQMEPGVYGMIAAPLRLRALDAAPARVWLVQLGR